MRIARVAEAPEHLPAIARAHVQAFGRWSPDWNVAEALNQLRSHAHGDAMATTWVALDGAQWLGSVSLLHADDAIDRQWSPRLASLYVRPQARRHGVGQALVARCVRAAADLRVGRLYLYCLPELAPFYRRLGWQIHTEVVLGPMQVVVMCIAPQETAP
ncbi:GNAT family N-acetyltransferase [Xanthomonas sp. NCPPB 1067]|uniref:GNAT family N-acetyltransferase n=1 Tax=Xanthomonas melonis TaxID=56456 RepID=A0A2S7DM05_9XANT|nr:GNAT family N-acetyltransferase [Xanthomonas melonis]MCC4589007.1 GNAT family N-acetyltransferase [Xanthomonas sp. NCPPB 1067]MCC4598919.1 GNAT family N-acetyltransferase [Xanthomonas melonis]PPU74822.1 GNAT family N-acetyltransferase [Xanthomonas melonis]